MKNYRFWSFLLSLSLLVACTSNNSPKTNESTATNAETDQTQTLAQETREIAPPLDNVLVPEMEMEVEVTEEFFQEFDNGTKIHIPANSLVDVEGNPVEGKVDVTYREFHDVVDVILSGIPMQYDSAGQTHTLQTAGMVEIRASQNGTPVFVADGKTINIEMASFQEGGYNLYSLDENTGGWDYMRTANPAPNPRLVEIPEVDTSPVDALPYTPFKPRQADENEPIFPIDADFSKYPELAHFKDLEWQWAGMEEEGTVNPSEEEWVFGQVWSSAQLDAKNINSGLFYLTLSNNQKNARMLVTPVVSKEEYPKAIAAYEQALETRKEVEKQRLAAAKRAEVQAQVVRNFQVQEFGIYNWDKIIKMPEPMQILADFKFDKSDDYTEEEIESVDRVFLVVADENIVVPYTREGWGSTWDRFIISPKVENKIVAVLPDNRIAVFDESDFAKYKINPKEYTFNMRVLDKRINAPEDLRDVLGV